MPRTKSGSSSSSSSQEPGPFSAGAVPPKSVRRRGRPRGNPKPLDQAQKKARNAQYERERRQETAKAMEELRDALKLENGVSNTVTLDMAIKKISEASSASTIDDMKQHNYALQMQIDEIKNLLAQQSRL